MYNNYQDKLTSKTLHNRRKVSAGSAVTALLFDEAMTRAAIELASPEVSTEADAAALFAVVVRKVLTQPRVPLGGEHMAAATFITYDWWVAQQQVRRLLPKIAKLESLSASGRKDLFDALNEGLIQEGQVTLQVTPNGVAIRVQSGSIVGAASLGLMPFLVPNGWPTNRLGQCRLKECGRYFLRPDGQRGRKSVFCRPEHANITHVREFRERKSEG